MKTLTAILAATLFLSITVPLVSSSQRSVVTGRVADNLNNPLPGVAVQVKGTTDVVMTDRGGEYSITAAKGDTLVFSLAGYETMEAEVTGPRMDVVMEPEIRFMEPHVQEPELSIKVVRDALHFEEFVESDVAYSQVESANHVQGMRVYPPAPVSPSPVNMYYPGGEEYGRYRENRFVAVSDDPLSTFSLDVDGASYSNIRRMLNNGQRPAEDAVRIEELVNYFSYRYPAPTGDDPVKINYEVAPCPWNSKHKLVRIGVKAREIPSEDLPPTNFVFLIDVSGSMAGRIELVKSSFKLLVNNLRPVDNVAIVVYASEVGIKLPATSGSDRQTINDAIDALRAGGSTAGGAGIQTAYRVARENFIEGGNNRIILATDGDFNVGVSSPQELERLIVRERESGVFLTVLGYGMGNYKDERIQTLAEKGNGNHAYIDNLQEAHRVLVEEFGGTMHTVAKDVKLQVEFNPAYVQAHRLVGYESRMLEHRDFNDDTKDAGELGVGHTVTAFYEIVPVGVESSAVGSVDALRYQPAQDAPVRAQPLGPVPYTGEPIVNSDPRPVERIVAHGPAAELMYVKLRYKDPDGDTSKLLEVPVYYGGTTDPSPDFHFAAAVVMFGQLLRNSEFKGSADFDLVVSTARRGLADDGNGYRREFIRLAEAAKALQ